MKKLFFAATVVKSIIVEDLVCFHVPHSGSQPSVTPVAENLFTTSGIHRHCIYIMNIVFETLSKSYTQNQNKLSFTKKLGSAY